jgi:O-methyltransferase
MPEAVHAYLVDVGTRPMEVRTKLRDATDALPNHGMQISIEQGDFMFLLLKAIGAKKCIEVGTFTGYSALVTAQALPPDGTLVCCDVSEEYTAVGKPFWAEAGVANKIDLRIAPATQTLDQLLKGYDEYYERGLQLLKPGGLIGIDNTIWQGKVADESETDPDTTALRALNAKLHADQRIDLSMVPIGDGLTLCRKR